MKLRLPKLAIRRFKEIREAVVLMYPLQRPGGTAGTLARDYSRERQSLCAKLCGMSWEYVSKRSKPEAVLEEATFRILRNLGLELLVRDIRTGEIEKLDIGEQCEVETDFLLMNLSSSSGLRKTLEEKSSGSE